MTYATKEISPTKPIPAGRKERGGLRKDEKHPEVLLYWPPHLS